MIEPAEGITLAGRVPERQTPEEPTVAISAGSVVRGAEVPSQTAGIVVHRLRRIEDVIDELLTDLDGSKQARRNGVPLA
ncbi:hypothetical protein [Amycolatopsis sp. 3B14]|uniref:hypothetical protein n=1 Tax=Amycolatopsis sp. 3B14 TaxID=3243600 RepID=UPI003D992D7F